MVLDERVHAYRRDIADIALAGHLFAPHYARPLMRGCGTRPAFVYPDPSDPAPSTQLLPGEAFAVLEFSGPWAWGYCRHDHYVGYVEAISLIEAPPPTHLVAAVEAPILPEPDIHVPHLATLPMGSRVTGHGQSGFLATDVGFIAFTHVRELSSFERDPVAVAQRLVGSPYLLGGRSPRGIDCSGLVQLSLGFCGIPSPRDSDQQRALGNPIADDAPLKRGDLISFEGHIGMMVDSDDLIHATGHHGSTIIEPLAEVAERTPILQRRRLAELSA
ncbi:MAG TPA: NlpC/P60 family protein [Allosphingosinicella sp.]|nr:NlpC/P60 family protein [Allosphingosinicella sp.]